MFGSWRVGASLLLISLITGCAEPKYETVQRTTGVLQDATFEGCGDYFRQSGYCLLWQWEIEPTSSQPGTLIFKVVRPNQLDGSVLPVDLDFTMDLVLWMPDMGHGSTPTSVERVDVGSYRASNVFFVMPGKWELKFQFIDQGALQDEAAVAVTF